MTRTAAFISCLLALLISVPIDSCCDELPESSQPTGRELAIIISRNSETTEPRVDTIPPHISDKMPKIRNTIPLPTYQTASIRGKYVRIKYMALIE